MLKSSFLLIWSICSFEEDIVSDITLRRQDAAAMAQIRRIMALTVPRKGEFQEDSFVYYRNILLPEVQPILTGRLQRLVSRTEGRKVQARLVLRYGSGLPAPRATGPLGLLTRVVDTTKKCQLLVRVPLDQILTLYVRLDLNELGVRIYSTWANDPHDRFGPPEIENLDDQVERLPIGADLAFFQACLKQV